MWAFVKSKDNGKSVNAEDAKEKRAEDAV